MEPVYGFLFRHKRAVLAASIAACSVLSGLHPSDAYSPVDPATAALIPSGWQDASLTPQDCETFAYIHGGQSTQVTLPRDNQGGAAAASFVAPYGSGAGTDADQDGIIDSEEQRLAEQYAPIIVHDKDDANLPASVDWVLQRTRLDYAVSHIQRIQPLPFIPAIVLLQVDQSHPVAPMPLKQQDLIAHDSGDASHVRSDSTRSSQRLHTFVLEDLDGSARVGSLDTHDWITYVHAFRNYYGGVTLQYWRSYAYNTGAQSEPVAIDNHGADWECVQIVLDNALKVVNYRLLGHTEIEVRPPDPVQREGDHVIIYSEPGGHTSRFSCVPTETSFTIHRIWLNDLNASANTIRQQTWTGGKVFWPVPDWRGHLGDAGDKTTPSGGLVNIGEKMHPLSGQVFVQYSGIWGSLGSMFSGYWGPAYNETMMGGDNFITAWGYGMKASKSNIAVLHDECYPASASD